MGSNPSPAHKFVHYKSIFKQSTNYLSWKLYLNWKKNFTLIEIGY